MSKTRATEPKLFVLSAPSGAGKTTLCAYLLETYAEKLVLSISTTTRKPRGREKNGREYFFVSTEEFKKKITAGEFAEWALVHDHHYGTSKKVIAETLADGRSVLLDIDVQGAAALRRAFGDQCVLIFVAPPNLDELERRLRSRKTDSEEVIQQRLRNAEAEMKRVSDFDHVVVNDNLLDAQARLRSIFGPFLGGAPR